MFGLFDWIWSIFYAISKSMYTIIDNLLACANMLCGIEPIRYEGAEMDFLTFLLRNQAITYAFVGAVLIAVFLVFIFGIIAIIRTIASEKIEKTPAQIAVSVGKTLLTFLFIPAAMTILIYLTNALMQILYSATLGGSPDGLGRFLAGAFGQDALKSGVDSDFYLDPSFNYHSTSNVKSYLDLSDYDYFFSYISGIVLIISLGMALLLFVDRAISLVILFVFAPISLSTTLIDDGARFKLWRDQFLTKFLTGYGAIIGINIYTLIVAAITNDNLIFFDNSVLNFMMKILIVVGGGISMQRIMALVGNLIASGAGSNELRDAALAGSSFRRAVTGGAMLPFSATRSAVNFGRDIANNGLGSTLGRAFGFKTKRDYDIERGRVSRGTGPAKSDGGSGNNKAGVGGKDLGAGNKNASNAIRGGANPGGNSNNSNKNSNANGSGVAGALGGALNQGSNMVGNAINNSLNNANNKNDDMEDLK